MHFRSPHFDSVSLQIELHNTLKLANIGPVTDHGLVFKSTFKFHTLSTITPQASGRSMQSALLISTEAFSMQNKMTKGMDRLTDGSREVHAHPPAGKG